MRAPEARTPTEKKLTQETRRTLAFWFEGIAPGSSEIAGPLTPYSLQLIRTTLNGYSPAKRIFAQSLKTLRSAAAEQGIAELCLPEELEPLVSSTIDDQRHAYLYAAKVLIEGSATIAHHLDDVATGSERRLSQQLGSRSSLFLNVERLVAALDESLTATHVGDQAKLLEETDSDERWSRAAKTAEALLTLENPTRWDVRLKRILCEALAERCGLLFCPTSKTEAVQRLQSLTGRSGDEICDLLEDYPAVQRMLSGRSPYRQSGKSPILGRNPVSISSVFDAMEAVRREHPDTLATKAPTVYAIRALRGKANGDYAICRLFKEQFGINVTDRQVARLFADQFNLDPPQKSSYELRMETVLRDILPGHKVVEQRRLPNLETMWRWDFRLEADARVGKLPTHILVEVHGEDHFVPVDRGGGARPSRRLADRQMADDLKTLVGIEWLDSVGGGTYMVIHHEVFSLVEGSEWFAEILEGLPGRQLPSWLYLRPAEGPGSTDWPGRNTGEDGLDHTKRCFKRFGAIQSVWVR